MKNSLFLCLFLIFGLTSMSFASENEASHLSWNEKTHDFGTIKQNQPVTFSFEFTNNGNNALAITSVRTSCGCTAAGYTREPLKPGETGHIEVTYNARAAGYFSKTIRVQTSNSDVPAVLTIKGNVTAP